MPRVWALPLLPLLLLLLQVEARAPTLTGGQSQVLMAAAFCCRQ
jgi:hypothetical protein